MPFFVMGSGDEYQQHVQNVENTLADTQAKFHNLDRMVDQMGKDDLESLHTWLLYAAATPNPMAAILYYAGSIERVMAQRFGRCFWDGINHEEEDKNFLNDAKNGIDLKDRADLDKTDDESAATPPPLPNEQTPAEKLRLETQSRLAAVNLERNPKFGSDEEQQPWRCTKCHYGYASITDRELLLDNDKCPGCMHKEKWG